jgi:predicted aminopeptidase
VGDQYTSYAAWPGDRVVTTVVATQPREIDPAEFSFPIVGRMPYKGFFDEARARDEAAALAGRGLDVCLVPVSAYSTLGWFDDPLTGPMARLAPDVLVETVIHELVHATVFAPDAAEFNEGIATFVGQEAAASFFQGRNEADGVAVRRRIADARAITQAQLDLRDRVAALYATAPAAADPTEQRAALEAAARAAIAALPLATVDARGLAENVQLNDACLSLTGTYSADLLDYAAKLEAIDGDLAALVDEARTAASADDPRAAMLGIEASAGR